MRIHVTNNWVRLRTATLCGALAVALAASPALAQKKGTGNKGTTSKIDGSDLAEEGLYNCRRARRRVSVSFKPEVNLKDLITWAMGFTCKNFVFGAGVGGRSAKVTIIAPKKMSPRQAWRVFLVALQTMNLTVVPKGNVLKIMEAPRAKTSSLPLYRRGGPSSTDQLVRVVIKPRHMPADDLATALNALKSKDGTVTSLGKLNVLLVTDYGSNITKMRYLLRTVDRPIAGGERLYMIKVKHADVTELAQKLTEILGINDRSQTTTRTTRTSRRNRRRGRRSTPTRTTSSAAEIRVAVPSKILADERINALILLATEAAYLRVRALVKRLDIALDVGGAGRIHVHYLDNADAEQLAGTLTTVISGIQQPSGRTTRGRTTRRTPTRGSSAAGAPAFEGQVRVTHDKPTNSLVVVASVKDFLALRQVIRKLDEPRRQVFIEATIMEVNLSASRDLGFSWHGGKALDSGGILLGGLQHASLSSLNVQSLASQTGLLGGALGPLLDGAENLLGVSIPSYGILFQALASNSNVNVLSSPHILTTDNEEAEISVGQNIPYQASLSGFPGASTGGNTSGGTTGFGFPVQSIQRQDVALTLKITPHINASDMVRLEIDQEINDIADPDFEGNGPSWSKRTIKTTVVVKDQQSIVIGGLMSTRDTYSESKVPLLGDIPILGYLFKQTNKSQTKTNLLVLLTPYVIKDQMDIEAIVQRKVRERNEFVRSFFNLARMKYRPNVDYRRKRGLIEEINNKVRVFEKEAEILKALEQKGEIFPDGPVSYDEDDDKNGKNGKGKKGDKNSAKASDGKSAPAPTKAKTPAGKKQAGKK
jgi:general secretion pathway protein D